MGIEIPGGEPADFVTVIQEQAERIANLEQALKDAKKAVKEEIWNDPSNSLLGIPLPEIRHIVSEYQQRGVDPYQLATLRQEKAALEQQVTALTKPVTAEEWNGVWLELNRNGLQRRYHVIATSLLASRARTAGSSKETLGEN